MDSLIAGLLNVVRISMIKFLHWSSGWAGVLHYQSQFPELKLNKQTLNIASDDAHISLRNSGMSPCAYHHPRCRTYKQLDNEFLLIMKYNCNFRRSEFSIDNINICKFLIIWIYDLNPPCLLLSCAVWTRQGKVRVAGRTPMVQPPLV